MQIISRPIPLSTGNLSHLAAVSLALLVHLLLLWLVIDTDSRLTAAEYARHQRQAPEFSVQLVATASAQPEPQQMMLPEPAPTAVPPAPEAPWLKPEIVVQKQPPAKKTPQHKTVMERDKKPPTEKTARKKPPRPAQTAGQQKPLSRSAPPDTAGAALAAAKVNSAHAGPRGDARQTLPSTNNSGERMAYLAKVRAAIEKNKRYPRKARRMKSEGNAGVEISLDQQGNIVAARLVTTSGDTSLDEAALEAVRAATSSGPPPPGVGRILTMRIAFSLNKR